MEENSTKSPVPVVIPIANGRTLAGNKARPWIYAPVCACGKPKDRRSQVCRDCMKLVHAEMRRVSTSPRKDRLRLYYGRTCKGCGSRVDGRSRLCKKCMLADHRPSADETIYRIKGVACRKVPLTQNFYTLVDAADYEAVMTEGNFVAKGPSQNGKYYAWRKTRIDDVYRAQPLPNFLLGYPCGRKIDHVNGNCMDNRRANLRPATNSQNGANCARSRANTSGHKNVFRIGPEKFRVLICKDRQRIHCGYYKTYEEACRVAEAKAIELFGEFACTGLRDDDGVYIGIVDFLHPVV